MNFNKRVSAIFISVCFLLSIINLPAYSATVIKSAKYSSGYSLKAPYYTPSQLAKKQKTLKAQVQKQANKDISSINKLLKKKGLNSIIKKWLKQAKKEITKIANGEQANSKKLTLLKKAEKQIKTISKQKVSIFSLIEQTTVSGSVFSSLKKVLKNNHTYKFYTSYVLKSKTLINGLLKKNTTTPLAKTYLNKAADLIDKIYRSNQGITVKKKQLSQALNSLKAISNANATTLSLIEQAEYGAFGALKTFLQDNSAVYRLYKKDNELINNLLNKGDVSDLSKNWLTKAGYLIKELLKGNNETEQEKLLEEATSVLEEVSNDNASITFLAEKTKSGGWGVFSSLYSVFSENEIYSLYAQNSSLIQELLGREITEQAAKDWLNLADTLIDDIINGNKSQQEKQTLFQQALASLNAISKNDVSMLSLAQQSVSGVFATLATVLKDDQTYQLYSNYVTKSISLIDDVLEQSDVAASIFKVTWLTQAKNIINEIMTNDLTYDDKQTLLQKALAQVTDVINENFSVEVLNEVTSVDAVFSSLKTFFDIYRDYADEGFGIITKLAKNYSAYYDITAKDVYDNFVTFGVSKFQLYKLYKLSQDKISDFVNKVNQGDRFINCGERALAAILNISQAVLAIQHIAADIAAGAYYNIGDWNLGEERVMQFNGKPNAKTYVINFEDFMESLQIGESGILDVDCFSWFYGGGGHAIAVFKEDEEHFSVADMNVKGCKKITYTIEEFKKLMSGDDSITATGIDKETGEYVEKRVYYKAVNGGNIWCTTDAQGVADKKIKIEKYGIPGTISIYDAEHYIQTGLSIIDELLNKDNLDETARTWLLAAKELPIFSVADVNNVSTLADIIASLRRIQQANASIISITKESESTKPYLAYFSSLKPILEENVIYLVYTKYGGTYGEGQTGLDLLNCLSEEFNLSKEIIYECFLETGLNTYDISVAKRYFDKAKQQIKEGENFADVYCSIIKRGGIVSGSGSGGSNDQRILTAIQKLIELAGLELFAI